MAADGAAEPSATDAPAGEPAAEEPASRVPAAERRRALGLLLDAWRDLARDLALAQAGATRSVRDAALLEELEAAARDLPPGACAATLARLIRAGELLESNVSPELLLDVLLVRWPRRRRVA